MPETPSATDVVLVVEDDISLAELICVQLGEEGLAARAVHTGRDALAWMAEQTPALVILDYVLPDMDGARLAALAGEMPPFVIATGMGDERIAVDMMKRGARDYLVKDAHFVDVLPVVVKRILDQLRTEQQLALSERRFEHAFTQSHVGMFLADGDGRLDQVNPMLCEMTGYSPDALAGRCFLDLAHPEDQESARAQFQALAGNAPSCRFETRLVHRDGSAVWVILTVTLVAMGPSADTQLVGHVQDITVRVTALRSLRESETRFEQVARQALEMIWEVDARGLYTYVSHASRDILGYEPDELVGRKYFYELHPEDGREAFKAAAFDAFTRTAAFRDLIDPAETKDGRVVWLCSFGSPMLTADGSLLGYRGLSGDVTERRKAEGELRRLEDQLRQSQKLDALGQLAAGVAHDFNNMLTVILGQAEMVRMSVEESSSAAAGLGVIEQACEQASEIVRSLLTFSRLAPASREAVEIGGAVQGAATLLRHVLPRIVQLDIAIRSNGDTWAMVDLTQFNQVLLNLAINARDAMPHGGTLRIETTGPHDPEQNAEFMGEPCVQIAVADNGTGIPGDVLPRVFDPFFTTKAAGKGTGLGLSVVHGIVTDHGGQITVQSEVDKGSVFRIALPCYRTKEEAASAAVRAPKAGHGEKILVAVGEDYLRGGLAAFLESAGYDPLLASDRSTLVELLRSDQDDIRLVVLDADLPDSGGLACLQQIREAHGGLPVVLVQGEAPVELPGRDEHTLVLANAFGVLEFTTAVAAKLRSCAETTA